MESNKISGFLGLLAVILILIAVIISYIQILEYYNNFNLFNNWMSELGVGPNRIILNVSIMIACLLLTPFLYGVINQIKTEIDDNLIPNICMITGIISIVGLFLIGLFPMEDLGKNNLNHAIGAFVYWSGSLAFWNVLAMIYRRNPNLDKNAMVLVNLTNLAWVVFICSFSAAVINILIPIVFQWIAHIFTLISFLYLALWLILK